MITTRTVFLPPDTPAPKAYRAGSLRLQQVKADHPRSVPYTATMAMLLRCEVFTGDATHVAPARRSP